MNKTVKIDQLEAKTENNVFSFASYTTMDCMVTEVK